MRCFICSKEIQRNQTAYRFMQGFFVHYRDCKAVLENAVHCLGWQNAVLKFIRQ